MRASPRSIATGLAALACACASLQAAAGTSSLTISATVLSSSNCKFQAGSASTLTLSNVALPAVGIDPSSATSATGSATVIVKCGGSAATATFSVSAGNGLYSTGPGARRMRNTTNAAEYLAYSLNTPVGATVGKNVSTNVVITATSTQAQFANAYVGGFTDTVVLTLTP